MRRTKFLDTARGPRRVKCWFAKRTTSYRTWQRQRLVKPDDANLTSASAAGKMPLDEVQKYNGAAGRATL
jgi:hypothetical protein